jgi:hypothetical protein
VFGFVQADESHQGGPVARGLGAVEPKRLLRAQLRYASDLARGRDIVTDIWAISDHEDSARFGDAAQAPKVDICTAHCIVTAWLDGQVVQLNHVAVPSLGDRDEGRQRPAQIERSGQLHRLVGASQFANGQSLTLRTINVEFTA